MSGTILLLHQYVFMAWCLVKYEDRFTLPKSFIVRVVRFSALWILKLISVTGAQNMMDNTKETNTLISVHRGMQIHRERILKILAYVFHCKVVFHSHNRWNTQHLHRHVSYVLYFFLRYVGQIYKCNHSNETVITNLAKCQRFRHSCLEECDNVIPTGHTVKCGLG